MAAPNNSSASTNANTQPISLIGTMGLVQNPQNISLLQNHRAQQIAAFQAGQARASAQQLVTGVRPIVNVVGNHQPTVATLQNVQVLVQNPQNISLLQNHRAQQIAAFQAGQARASAQQLVTGVRPIVNVVGNHQPTVATLQNVQVLGSAGHQDGIGTIPINIITTGGQTFAVASNLQGGIPAQVSQMQIRPIAPNAGTVVSQLQGNTSQQIRAAFDGRKITQVKVPNVGTMTGAAASVIPQPIKTSIAHQPNLTLPIHTATTNISTPSNTSAATTASSSGTQPSQILTKRKLQDLLHEIDPTETMDDDVEEALLHMADDFIENVITASCQLAKHRRSNILDVKDVQLHLDRNWNMWIPGFGSEDLRPYKKAPATEAHKQRLALIKKAMKK